MIEELISGLNPPTSDKIDPAPQPEGKPPAQNEKILWQAKPARADLIPRGAGAQAVHKLAAVIIMVLLVTGIRVISPRANAVIASLFFTFILSFFAVKALGPLLLFRHYHQGCGYFITDSRIGVVDGVTTGEVDSIPITSLMQIHQTVYPDGLGSLRFIQKPPDKQDKKAKVKLLWDIANVVPRSIVNFYLIKAPREPVRVILDVLSSIPQDSFEWE